MEDGCYNFVIFDTFGDGFCCNYGNGFFNIKKEINGSILASSSAFAFTDTAHFCINALTINQIEIDEVQLFPNPSTGTFYVNYPHYSKNISNYAKFLTPRAIDFRDSII